MKRLYFAAFTVALLVSYLTGIVSHDVMDRATLPYRCAVVHYFNPSVKCQTFSEQHRPPQLKQELPGQKVNG